MKLRNKKTGGLANINGNFFRVYTGATWVDYNSLAELNEKWEDYKPKEPLIKDEKVRKAVRAWAEAESIPAEETVFYNSDIYHFGWYRSGIEFSKHIEGLKESEYTIFELCGEEE